MKTLREDSGPKLSRGKDLTHAAKLAAAILMVSGPSAQAGDKPFNSYEPVASSGSLITLSNGDEVVTTPSAIRFEARENYTGPVYVSFELRALSPQVGWPTYALPLINLGTHTLQTGEIVELSGSGLKFPAAWAGGYQLNFSFHKNSNGTQPLQTGNARTLFTANTGLTFPQYMEHFGLTGTNALETGDPDKDGIPNLIEYGVGSHPNKFSPTPLNQPVPIGSNLIVDFNRPVIHDNVNISVE